MYKKVLSIIISVIIIVLSIIFIISEDKKYSLIENRYLKTFPKFSFEKLLKGKYTEEIEKYTEDQFPMRDTFMGINLIGNKIILKRKIDDYPNKSELARLLNSDPTNLELIDLD